MKTATKLTASQKKELHTIESIYRILDKKTLDLRERFYASYTNFFNQQLQENLNELNDKLKRATSGNRRYSIESIQEAIERQETKMNQKLVNQLKWTLEAKENFDAKLNKVTARLVSFGVNSNIKIDETWIESSQEMSFVIDAFDTFRDKIDHNVMLTAHARMIWVSCTEKASHWRFICTKRKAK